MSLLTGPKIEEEVRNKRIIIDPYDPKATGPNSHDLTLAPKLLTYRCDQNFLDVRQVNPTVDLMIPPEGKVLYPGILYLASTVEVLGSNHYAATVEGKSSLGRLGLQVHMAGFIDCGYIGNITLEITVIHPLRVYSHMRVAQLCFSALSGPIRLYKGKYKGDAGVEASRAYQDFEGQAP